MATGRIFASFVHDFTAGRTYHSRDFPVAIPAEHEVAALAGGQNTSGRTLSLRMTVELRDPAGRVRASRSNAASVDHGRVIWSLWSTPRVRLDREGTWSVTARLEEVEAR